MRKKKPQLDSISKTILVFIVVAVSYVASFAIIAPFMQPSAGSGMRGMMAAFDSYYNTIAFTAALIPALLAGLVVALAVRTKKTPEVRILRESKDLSEYKILKRAMSNDEARMYDEIRRAGKITQDSLRARLEWSKAKTSRILTNLDKMNLVQRERVGKTYNVFVSKSK